MDQIALLENAFLSTYGTVFSDPAFFSDPRCYFTKSETQSKSWGIRHPFMHCIQANVISMHSSKLKIAKIKYN